jgi:hypothetical protein
MDVSSMSFREKSVWISFLTILGVFVPFFWNSYRQFTGAISSRESVGTAFTLLTAFLVIEIVLHAVLAIRAPREARSPRDERERMIDLRATRVGFYVLLLGAMSAVGAVHLTRSAWAVSQVALLAVVVAELVRFGIQIVLFRRDA